MSTVSEIPAAASHVAAAHFAARLSLETDCADVAAALKAGAVDFVLLHVVGSPEAYARRHVPGAISLPTRSIDAGSAERLPKDRLVVVYCWGPGCNGATKAAVRLSALGFRVKEMIGGIEYWRREGHPVEGSAAGSIPVDPLVG